MATTCARGSVLKPSMGFRVPKSHSLVLFSMPEARKSECEACSLPCHALVVLMLASEGHWRHASTLRLPCQGAFVLDSTLNEVFSH